jgi:membrane-associated protease RseP (regulator of RpoE activity)
MSFARMNGRGCAHKVSPAASLDGHMGTLLGAVAFVVLILFAILFHEFGHYVTARWAGIKVSKFFIGFGPTLWSYRRGRVETFVGPNGAAEQRPETEYGVKLLPIGGFVKIVGMSPFEELAPEDEPRAFGAAPRWKRAIVLTAGSVTHFITAFLVLFVIFAGIGIQDPTHPTLEVGAVASEVAGKPSPAAKAGLHAHDRIVAIDGHAVGDWTQVRNAIRSHASRQMLVTVKRDANELTIPVTPFPDKEAGKSIGVIGIYPQGRLERLNPIAAVGRSGSEMKMLVTGFFHTAPRAFSPQTLGLTGGKPSNQRPFSILGAGRIAADLAGHGQIAIFLFLFVQINIFIAIFNMLPLPPLDGGHLLVLAIEKIRGKPVDQRALVPVMAVVFSILMLLAVLLVYYDIVSPVHVPVP